MTKQKGLSTVFATILAVIIIGGGIYLFTKNKAVAPTTNSETQFPSQTTTTTSVDTSTWKTYRNDKYGFEFKYPPTEYELLQEDNLSYVQVYPVPQSVEFGPGLSVDVTQELTPVTSITDYINNKYSSRDWDILSIESKGQYSVMLEMKEKDPAVGPGGIDSRLIIIGNTGRDVFTITYGHNSKEYNEVFKQILSTFRFTK